MNTLIKKNTIHVSKVKYYIYVISSSVSCMNTGLLSLTKLKTVKTFLEIK